MSSAASSRSIEFHPTALGAIIILLNRADPAGLADHMHKMLGGRPNAFNNDAAILDFGAVETLPTKVDWNGLTSLMRRFRLQPIGVKNLDEDHLTSARLAGLAVLDHVGPGSVTSSVASPATSTSSVKQAPEAKPKAPEPAPAPPAPATNASGRAPALYIDRQVRSGQRVYAHGGDLVLLAGVSAGAEVLADGNIHCYGPLLGRAAAGLQGETEAKIIATHFSAELVSIAGIFRTFEQGLPAAIANRAVIVRARRDASKETIVIDPLQLD
ncbi:putative septum site-determining protein MinC [Betaproteobacteria bacterium]|nr:putative septum site-determining protein MinC [Betaproteobacteria bacterium]